MKAIMILKMGMKSAKVRFENLNWLNLFIWFMIVFIVVLMVVTSCLIIQNNQNRAKPIQTYHPTVRIVPVFTPTPIPTLVPTEDSKTIHFGEPMRFPASLDELYKFIETKEPGYVFPSCPESFKKPYLDWGMIQEIITYMADDNGNGLIIIDAGEFGRIIESGGGKFIDKGFLVVSEDDLFFGLLSFGLDGQFLLCSVNNDGFPSIWSSGNGVQMFLDWLQGFVIDGDDKNI